MRCDMVIHRKGEGQHKEEGEEEGAQKYKHRNQINELIIHEGWYS